MAENIKIKNKRNGKIELLRFTFSLVVALFHFLPQIGEPKLLSSGFFAVEFFFIVTGYLLAKSLSKYNCTQMRSELVAQTSLK